MTIRSMPSNDNYRDNFDQVFKKEKKECGCKDVVRKCKCDECEDSQFCEESCEDCTCEEDE